MPTTNVQSAPTSPLHITLLSVSPDGEDRSLESILGSPGWTVHKAVSIREAIRLMRENPSLIVCDRNLPDGSWKDILRQAEKLENPPPVVVAARNADQKFWAEVLNVGAFDVLLKPFAKDEVTRVMSMAFRCFQATAAA